MPDVPGPILVTGATGFAGSHLLEHLLHSHSEVVAWSNPCGNPPTDSDPRVTWRAVDLLDRAGVARQVLEHRPAAIYHCAGMADVGGSWARPEQALHVNAIGSHHVLEAVRTARLPCRVLITGSALVYRPSEQALDEQSPLGPSNPYALSKLAQEMLALRREAGDVVITRSFNHAGPRQPVAYSTSSFAKQIAQIEAGAIPAVIRVGNLESRRDITDVRDVVRAYALLVQHGRPRRPYNVCSGRAYKVGDLLQTLTGLSRVPVNVEIDPARVRPVDNPLVLGDPARLVAETGWAPQIPIERTLADLLDHWRRRVRES